MSGASSSSSGGVVPVTVVTGFLGAGKTTLLNRILREAQPRRIGVLVNDFGDINIDSQLIASVESDRIALTNGCICCSIRNDLVSAMAGLVLDQPGLDHVVIEASGISDPVGIAETLFQPMLTSRLSIDGIIAVVDTMNYPDLDFDETELALRQIAVADIVLLNKIDLAVAEKLVGLREDMRLCSPRARFIETCHAEVPLSLILGLDAASYLAIRQQPSAHHHADAGHGFVSMSWRSERAVDLKRFREFVRTLPIAVYRAKGFLHLASPDTQCATFHLVGKRSSLEAALTTSPSSRSELVFIARRNAVNFDHIRLALDQCCT
ncbi:GTP-binding protein [Acidiphilium sp. AL]|uniref:CobW family GTP-binding protein n=1 Tax=Acidiphilium sp. AL TaxID=2871704 RepID=UPI0021CB89B6|nr:GTP-binding protein [Acidiphilium sp. AL]MCU4162030.1 GTP-binding protein [Acidiphilium sp. AL]